MGLAVLQRGRVNRVVDLAWVSPNSWRAVLPLSIAPLRCHSSFGRPWLILVTATAQSGGAGVASSGHGKPAAAAQPHVPGVSRA